jgi:hypothetical protein
MRGWLVAFVPTIRHQVFFKSKKEKKRKKTNNNIDRRNK